MATKRACCNIKCSYGIACFKRASNRKLSLIVIKRKCSYTYYEVIVMCKDLDYKRYSQMTNHERDLLQTMNFKLMWIYIYGPTYKIHAYTYAKNKFMEKNASKVAEITKIPTPPSETNLFQIPKGRKKLTKETKLNCALREFTEETGIDRTAINVYPSLNFTQKWVDDGVTYIMTFYLGLLKDYDTPYMSTSHEVENVLDMSLEEVNIMSRIAGKKHELFKTPAVMAFKMIKKIIKFRYKST